jgi:hypothetical protein
MSSGHLLLLAAVVAHQVATVALHPAHELDQLEPDQAALVAQLDDVALDLGRDALHALDELEHVHHVADGDEVLDLQCGQGGGVGRPAGSGTAPGWTAPGWPG